MTDLGDILRNARNHISRADWNKAEFEWHKSAACAWLSQLTYLAIPDLELDDRGRFKLVPSSIYQTNIQIRINLVTIDAIRSMDVEDIFIVSTRDIVAIGIILQDILFICVRGTSSLYQSSSWYDWGINLKFGRDYIGRGIHLHSGFLSTVVESLDLISEEISKIIARRRGERLKTYITGHSLGGAVSSIMYNILNGYFLGEDSSRRRCACIFGEENYSPHFRSMHHQLNLQGIYTYGMPRFGNISAILHGKSPYHVLHSRDIVPKMPLRKLGYADGTHNRTLPSPPLPPELEPGSHLLSEIRHALWLPSMIARKRWFHSIENYVQSVESQV